MCVYWDEIFLSESSAAPVVTQTRVPTVTADVRFRGFSASKIHPERKQPETFYYQPHTELSYWNPTPMGKYTRYGDVLRLLEKPDDQFVIMGAGDEVRMQFNAGALPAVARGMRRDFLLKVDGWAKDRDANTAFSQSTEPLPFHGMSSYPYAAGEHVSGDAGDADVSHNVQHAAGAAVDSSADGRPDAAAVAKVSFGMGN